MKNETLEALQQSASDLVETLPDLLMDGEGYLYARPSAGVELAAAKPGQILAWVHDAKDIAKQIRHTLDIEPFHGAAKKRADSE